MLRGDSGVSRMVAAAAARDDRPMNEEKDPEPESPRRLIRSQEGRLITGVCAGLARYTRIDAIVFRVTFGLLLITTGVGIVIYIGAFLLMGTPDGGPSKIEQWSKRVFDGDTVLALLGAALAVTSLLGIAGHWNSGRAFAVLVVFGLALLVARSRGVDLVAVSRSMPDRIKGRPLASWTPPAAAAYPYPVSEGMVDLARLGRRTDTYAGGPYAPGVTLTPPAPDAGPGTADITDPAVTDDIDTPRYSPPPAPPARRRSYLTVLTLLTAALAAAVLHAVAGDRPHFGGVQVVVGGALAVVGGGLLLGAWFGRDRKLVLVGALMSFALACTSIAGNAAVARKTHHMTWRPAAVPQAAHSHKVLVGQGVVDLTTVPLSPGQRLEVNAEVTLGVLAVKVPSTARVEVDGHAYLGDITVDRQVTSGPGARVRRVLEPVAPPSTPIATIVLRIRSKVGDMEVSRVPA
jgi:phage shock protein PspC (stress-responsive transcriptional regulator)